MNGTTPNTTRISSVGASNSQPMEVDRIHLTQTQNEPGRHRAAPTGRAIAFGELGVFLLPQHRGGSRWAKRAKIVCHRNAASPSLTLPQLGGGDSQRALRLCDSPAPEGRTHLTYDNPASSVRLPPLPPSCRERRTRSALR